MHRCDGEGHKAMCSMGLLQRRPVATDLKPEAEARTVTGDSEARRADGQLCPKGRLFS